MRPASRPRAARRRLGRSEPARTSNSSSWPWPSSATTPRTSPGWSSNEASWSLGPHRRGCGRSSAGVASGGALRRGDGRSSQIPRRPAPSMSSTIRSSEPAVTSTTPTVSPSRRTVARSQTAAISMSRWEMKMTARSPPRCRPTTSSTRSVRFAGSAAVISSSMSTSGSMARARARSTIRSEASGTCRARLDRARPPNPSSPSQWRNGSIGVSVRRRLARMSRSGMRAGSW